MRSTSTILLVLCCALTLGAAEPDPGHEGHGDEGPAQALGEIVLDGSTFTVSQHGEVIPGGEAVYSIAVAQGTAPAELRAWIGVAHARGSVRSLLEGGERGRFHGHLAVPDPLPADSALWIEVVGADASRQRASVALPVAGHDHAGHGTGAHDHAGHGAEGHDHAGHGTEGHDH